MRWSQKQCVGVIGLGIIGSRVAANLRKKDFRVYVWNRTPKTEPNFLGYPADVAKVADILQIFVSDGPALSEVVASLLPELTKNHLVLIHPTVAPEMVREVSARITARGAEVLDAPFTGSLGAAEAAGLVYYIGGSPAALERARPVLAASSKAIVPLGEIGTASLFKLATNMITAATTQILSEAAALVKSDGIDPSLLTAALEQNGARSGVVDLKLPKILSGDFEPHFSLRNMAKDMRYALQIAEAHKLDLPVLAQTSAKLEESLAKGWGDSDFSVVARNLPGLEGPKEESKMKHAE